MIQFRDDGLKSKVQKRNLNDGYHTIEIDGKQVAVTKLGESLVINTGGRISISYGETK